MISIFAIPKEFTGHIGIIQKNAIESWRRMVPAPEIVLLGDEGGVREYAGETGAAWCPEIRKNKFGTPLISSIFRQGQRYAHFPVVCYVNADIIFLPGFPNIVDCAARWAKDNPFLLVGRRHNLDMPHLIDFDNPQWHRILEKKCAGEGMLDRASAIDYFVFPGGMFTDIPPFAVGRVAWDNWILHNTRSRGIPIIDATECATVFHQNHAALPVLSNHRRNIFLEEMKSNRRLVKPNEICFSLYSSSHQCRDMRIVKSSFARRLYGCIQILGALGMRLIRGAGTRLLEGLGIRKLILYDLRQKRGHFR